MATVRWALPSRKRSFIPGGEDAFLFIQRWDQRWAQLFSCYPPRDVKLITHTCALSEGRGTNGTHKDFLGTALYCEEYLHTLVYLTAYRLYMNYRCYQITMQWHIFIQIGSAAKCWLDIYRWGAGLAVTGRMRDVWQSVLQSAFET